MPVTVILTLEPLSSISLMNGNAILDFTVFNVDLLAL